MRRCVWLFAILLGLAAPGVRAEEPVLPPAVPGATPAAPTPVPPAPESPASPTGTVAALVQLNASRDTLPVTLRDDRRDSVTLRIPRSLHRDANRFRLYGTRPFTLWSHDRRRDLYRDAFLEVATYSRLSGTTTAWDSVGQQWKWLASQSPELGRLAGTVPALKGLTDAPRRATGELLKDLAKQPGYPQLSALLQALAGSNYKPEATEPMVEALQLRALATDEAARRLALLGQVLSLDGPGADPAMKEGYLAARTEFEEVRQGLWPALAVSVRKNQGRLILSAAKQIVLSRVGWWALFGQLAWQGAESTVNAEYRGQYAIALATVATRLGDFCVPEKATTDADRVSRTLPVAVYAEYALNYQLTEAHKTGEVMGLKPAGGISTMEWQLRFSDRCSQARHLLESSVPGLPIYGPRDYLSPAAGSER